MRRGLAEKVRILSGFIESAYSANEESLIVTLSSRVKTPRMIIPTPAFLGLGLMAEWLSQRSKLSGQDYHWMSCFLKASSISAGFSFVEAE
jgi:hypothetical protein